jgi:hypothetical protein
MFQSQGEVIDIASYNDRIYFVLDESGTTRIIKEHVEDLVETGWIAINEIRFNTTERKVLRYFDLLSRGVGQWSLELSAEGGAFVAIETNNSAGGYDEKVMKLEATRMGLRISLHRDPGDSTQGPSGLEWRLRADPRSAGRFLYMVSLMTYDFVVTGNGNEAGKDGQALEDLTHLKRLYRSPQDFIFQGPETSIPGSEPPPSVVMEDLRFKKYSPPEGGRGYGGITLAILRETR